MEFSPHTLRILASIMLSYIPYQLSQIMRSFVYLMRGIIVMGMVGELRKPYFLFFSRAFPYTTCRLQHQYFTVSIFKR